MTMPKLYYTNDNTVGWPVGYSQFDVLERVLCDGWGKLDVVKAEARDNYLHLEFATDVPKSLTWYALVELTTRVAAIDGYYRCVGVNGKTASFTPVDRIVPDYQGSAAGSLDHCSAGWTKVFKDADTLVVRPKGESSRCFLVRQNLHQHGYIDDLNKPWRLLTIPNNSSQHFANNAFMQIVQLSGWDSTLSVADNYTRYVMPAKMNVSSVITWDNSTVPSVMNAIAGNTWYIVATDSYCYFGSIINNGHLNITGIGIAPDVYGIARSFFIGHSWQHITNYASYAYSRGVYGISTPINTTSLSAIEAPDGKTVLKGLNTTTCNLSYVIAQNSYRFKYAAPKCDPVVASMVSQNSAPSAYLTLPGVYWYNGNLQATMSINTVGNRDILCVTIGALSNINNSSPDYCSYVGVEL